MRPVILFSAMLLALASCKKSYHCTCDNPLPPNASTKVFDIKAEDEIEALKECMNKAGDSHSAFCQLD